MTSINDLQRIVEMARSLSDRKEKLEYLNTLDRDVLNFLAGNITKEGIAKAIASEIPISTNTKSSVEDIVSIFKLASNQSRRKNKIRLMHTILLSKDDRDLVITILYGSLKLGLKIPIPNPIFGEVIKPQLCGIGIEFDPSKYIIEEKFDGIRCIATKNNGKITLQSRNGKILNIPHIEHSLIHCIPDGTTVDGEIIAADGQFQSLDRKSNNLIYMIFDIIFTNIPEYFTKSEKIDDPLYTRHTLLKNIINESNSIKISQPLNLNTMEEIDNWIVETESEGIVAKDPNSLYKYSDRKLWIKYKHFLDISGYIIGYTPGEGRREGTIGAVEFQPDDFKDTTLVGSGFNDDQLIEMQKLIDGGNKIRIDVKYQGITNDKRLRFPTFLRIREINSKEI